MSMRSKNSIIFILLIIIAIVASFLQLYGIFMLFAIGISLFIVQVTTLTKVELCWLVLLFSAFFGSYLGIPGHENIFLFRVLLLVYLVWGAIYFFKKFNMDQQDKFVLGMLVIWFAGSLLTLFRSDYMGPALRQFYYMFEASSLIFLTAYFFKTKKMVQPMCRIITVVYVASISVGIYEVLAGKHLKFSGSLVYETTTSQFQPTGFLFNTNDFSIYLALFLPLVFNYLYSSLNRSWSKIMAIALWGISIYLIISSYSRLGMLAIAVVSVAIIYYHFRKYALPLLLGVAIYLLIGKDTFEVLTEKILLSFTTKERSSNDRLNLYYSSLLIARDSHFLGAGLGSIPVKIAEMRSGYETIPAVIAAPHNFFLELIGEMGIFSTSFFLLLGNTLFNGQRFIWKGKKFLYCIPCLMLLVFLFGSVALSTIIEQRFFWISLGIAIAIPNNEWNDN